MNDSGQIGGDGLQRWLSVRNVVLGLLALSVMSYPVAWSGMGSFVLRDYGVFGYPLAHYHRETFWAGEIPLWNPLNYCGLPFLAQWNSMTLYPGSLIYLVLPMPWSLSVFCLLHQLLGGIGMFVLGRRWSGSALAGALAAVAYSFNGLMQHALMWPNNIAAFGLLPWVIWLVARGTREGGRWLVGAALVGACQMLTGGPEIILLTWVIAGLMLFIPRTEFLGAPWSHRLVRYLLLVLVVSALCAAQLLPFFEFIGQSTRIFTLDHSAWSYEHDGWMNVLLPMMNADQNASGVLFLAGQGWSQSFYPGLLLLVMPVWAIVQRPRPLVILFSLLVLAAFDVARGSTGILYPIIDERLGLALFRFPVKAMLLLTVLLPVLSLFVWRSKGLRSWTGLALGGGIVLLAFTYVVIATGGELLGAVPREQILQNGWQRLAWFVVAITALVTLARSRTVRLQTAMGFVLLASLWLDLKTHAPTLAPTVQPELLSATAVDTTDMYPKPGVGDGRFAMSEQVLHENHYLTGGKIDEIFLQHRLTYFDNLNLLDGQPKFGGFYTMYHFRLTYVAGMLYARAPEWPNGLADFLGLCQVTSRTNLMNWEPRISAESLVLAGQRPVFVPDKQAVAAIGSPNFNPREIAIFEPALKGELKAEPSLAAKVSDLQASAHELRFRVQTSRPTIATIAQTYYEPWRAEINGQPTPIRRANYAFQAVEVPVGDHEIVLRYVDKTFQKGALISIVALLLCAYSWIRLRPVPTRRLPSADPLLATPPLLI
ncbi:MAG: YfhO family protein [Limisphaerales bacterium]